MVTRRAFLIGTVASAGYAVSSYALAQAFPSRPVRIVVAQAPGGPAEFIMRLVAERLSSALGRPVIIENRPGGAGGTISAKFVASSDPDGHTLYWSYPGPLTTAPLVYRNLGFNPTEAFAPVAMVFSAPFMLGIPAAIPAKSIGELVSYLKANSKQSNYASAGLGTLPHLLGELFKLTTGVTATHVPYRGGGQAMQALVAGDVGMLFDSPSGFIPHIDGGRVRALAVTGKPRLSQLANIPTTIESGFPRLQGTFWTGIVAPAGTPAAVIRTLNQNINSILRTDEVRTVLAKHAVSASLGSPEDFAAFMAAETKMWSETIAAANIRAD